MDVEFTLNGKPARAPAGVSVAVAVMANGVACFRRSPSGEARGPVCGMGVCFECRATVDGTPHVKTCQVPLAAGMAVVTDE